MLSPLFAFGNLLLTQTSTCYYRYSVLQISFNPQGNRLLTGSSDKTARIWDVQTGQCLQILEGHTDEIFSCAFNYKGNIVITGMGEIHTIALVSVFNRLLDFWNACREGFMLNLCSVFQGPRLFLEFHFTQLLNFLLLLFFKYFETGSCYASQQSPCHSLPSARVGSISHPCHVVPGLIGVCSAIDGNCLWLHILFL